MTSPVFNGTVNTIPLVNTPQTLTITLAGISYNLRVRWNQINLTWVIDIYDSQNNPILLGIPMVTGADLLEQFGYLDFGGMLIAQTADDPDAPPTFQNLGTDGNLFFVVPG